MRKFFEYFLGKSSSKISKILFVNDSEHDLKICLEPWCHEYRVKAGVSAEIVGEGPIIMGEVTIRYDEDFITIFAWEDDMNLLIDGKKAEMDFSEL